MTSQRGVALILALMVLAFLTVLGGALLTTSTIDIRISDNFKTGVQSLYLAEAGIDDARELLRTSGSSATELLTAAAGSDGVLAASSDLASLLASDDQPLIPVPSLRAAGQPLTDSSEEIIGRYHVWLRNDNADGMTARTDTNQVLTLVSIAKTGNAQKVLEVTIRKAGFDFDDPALKTTAGLDELVARITAIATDVYNPPTGIPQTVANYGSAAGYRIAVVNGDVNLGGGTGYGILLARGDVAVTGNFTWNGLILVIGRGTIHWNDAGSMVNGGVFSAGTRVTEPWIQYDPLTIDAANRRFPYLPIAIKER